LKLWKIVDERFNFGFKFIVHQLVEPHELRVGLVFTLQAMIQRMKDIELGVIGN
jgi:hypothetical protein